MFTLRRTFPLIWGSFQILPLGAARQFRKANIFSAGQGRGTESVANLTAKKSPGLAKRGSRLMRFTVRKVVSMKGLSQALIRSILMLSCSHQRVSFVLKRDSGVRERVYGRKVLVARSPKLLFAVENLPELVCQL